MSDLILEAANVLVPIAAMGAGAAETAASSEAGKSLYEPAQRILGQLRGHAGAALEAEGGAEATVGEMKNALDIAVADGAVTEDDLELLVQAARKIVPGAGQQLTATIVRNAFVGNEFRGTVNIN